MMLIKNRFNPGIALLILCLLLSACGLSETGSLSEPKVLVFVRDEVHIHDVEIMLSMLEEAGILAVIATESENSYQGSEPSLMSDILLQDVNVADYDGFLLPCFNATEPGPTGDVVIAMVVEAAAQKKPVAAQHLSVHLLGHAGLLDGIHYAFRSDTYPDGIYDGTGVARDGNIITSGCCSKLSLDTGCADGTVELTQKLIEAVSP